MNLVRIAAAAILFGLSAAGAYAADKDAPAPVSAEPQNTAATYGDWVLRCAKGNDGSHACEIVQQFVAQSQGQQQPLGQLAIGHLNPKDPLHVTFIVSPNVAFPSDVKLMTDDKDTQPILLNWSNCLPNVCRADGEFKEDQVKRFKTLTASGKLIFKPANGQLFSITVSLRGFSQAMDALAKS